MTKVKCVAWCQFSKDGVCTKDEIEMDIEGCVSFEVYPAEDDPEYQEEYWILVKRTEDKKLFRQKARGKRIEIDGVVFHTKDDVRYGLTGVELTEERTGLKTEGEKAKNAIDIVRQKSQSFPAVMDYPTLEELDGPEK